MFTSMRKVSFISVLVLALTMALILVNPVHAESVSPTDPTGTEIATTEEPIEVPETPVITETPAITETPQATETPSLDATLDETGTEEATEHTEITETPSVVPDVTETEDPTILETATEDPNITETAAATEDPAVEDATAEALDELAENDIQLVDGSGDALALATEETSELIANGDPYFIVDGVTYRFAVDCTGLENCTESATPIQAAIDYMEVNNLAPTDGKLYIEAGTYTENVVVDGAKNGVSGLNAIVGNGATPADVVINGSITLQNIENGFSISNLTVVNTSDNNAKAIDATENISGTIIISNVVATESGRNGIGIKIKTDGDVYLDNVNASGSGYLGCGINASGSITVVNSVFTNNGFNYKVSVALQWYDWYSGGLTLHSSTGSSITVDGVTASGNNGFGANIGFPDIQIAEGTITIQNSEFNDNTYLNVGSVVSGGSAEGDGLHVNGVAIVLVNIEANGNSQYGIDLFAYTSFTGSELSVEGNGSYGMYVETCRNWSFMGYCVNNTKGVITISNSNADANKDGGIFIVSKGTVTLNSVSAEQNEAGGLKDGDGAGIIIITVFATSSSSVNLIFINSSENNLGIEILAKGPVNLSNVTTNSNNNIGLYIDNSYGSSPVNMTINKNTPTINNESNSNGGDGIIIYSNAAVTIMNVEACNNGGGGVYIDTTYYGKIAPVVISVVDPLNGSNNFSSNSNFGLAVYSYGTVKISSINASGNAEIGAFINNQLATGTNGPSVTISNSTFDMNCQPDEEGNCEYGNEVPGLEVKSFGVVTLLNVSASKNDGTGIIVITNGMISATNIVANENNGDGAYFDNSLGSLFQSVSLFASTGEGNSFLNNTGCGLMIVTKGTVAINNITANGNSMGYGLYIDNSIGRGSVTIKQTGTWLDSSGNQWLGNVFNNNKNGGVYIKSNGNVTVNFFSIKANEGSGIIIIDASSSGAVILNGLASNYANNISANQGGDGISITAKGNITLNNIQSVDNGEGNGAFLDNSTGMGGITITNGYFNGNKIGLIIESNGAVVWTNGSASDNSGLGASINNMVNISTNKSVKISNVKAERNGETGLNILSKGSVNLTNVSADSNSANGYELQMDDLWNDVLNSDQTWTFAAPDSGQVTINLASEDFSPAIEIYDGEGNLIASGSATSGELTITISDLSAGEIYQIKIMSGESEGGVYSIDISDTTNQPSSFTVKENKAYGIYIDNSQGSSAPVTLTNSTQNYENSGTNVYIRSSGAVAITNLDSTNSAENGLVVINTNSATPQPVTLTNITTNSNGLSGTIVITKGTVTIKTGTANSNEEFGLQINNAEGTGSVALTSFTSNNNDETGIVITSNGSVKMVSVTCNQNTGSGIEITTLGAVTFTYVNAVGNHGYGSYVVTQSTFMNTSSALGYSQFNQNYEDGLYVEAKGAISITKVSASNNGYDSEGNYIGNAIGLNIHGTDASGKSPIRLTDIRAENNSADGLFITTASSVTITTLEANYNRGDGLNIQQTAAITGYFSITLTSINAVSNGGDGINANAVGKITVTNFVANNNGGNGVDIVDSGTTGSVTLTAGSVVNQANNNGGAGVLIDSVSTVTVIGLEANNNSGVGILVDNSDSSALATVILTKVVTNTNEGNGVQIVSKGNTTLNTVSALSNDQNGIYISTTASVTMNRSTASTNDWSGFYVDAPTLKLSACIYTDNVQEPLSGDEKNLLFTGLTLIGV